MPDEFVTRADFLALLVRVGWLQQQLDKVDSDTLSLLTRNLELTEQIKEHLRNIERLIGVRPSNTKPETRH